MSTSDTKVVENVKKPSKAAELKQFWINFKHFAYNRDTGEVLGRSGNSWLKIFIFYVIFYAALAAFFMFMLFIFLCTLPKDGQKYPNKFEVPKYRPKDDIFNFLKMPGLSNLPRGFVDASSEAPDLIVAKPNTDVEVKKWIRQLSEYMKEAKVHIIPKLNPSDYGPCKGGNFGYDVGEPCVLVRLNKVIDWKPTKNGKENACGDLVVTITCEAWGDTGTVTIEHYPQIMNKKGGLIQSYDKFTDKNKKHYVAPFIMVKIKDLKPNPKKKGSSVTVKCTHDQTEDKKEDDKFTEVKFRLKKE